MEKPANFISLAGSNLWLGQILHFGVNSLGMEGPVCVVSCSVRRTCSLCPLSGPGRDGAAPQQPREVTEQEALLYKATLTARRPMKWFE